MFLATILVNKSLRYLAVVLICLAVDFKENMYLVLRSLQSLCKILNKFYVKILFKIFSYLKDVFLTSASLAMRASFSPFSNLLFQAGCVCFLP